jgi:hypothetical protein
LWNGKVVGDLLRCFHMSWSHELVMMMQQIE